MSYVKSTLFAAALLSASASFAIVPEGSYPQAPGASAGRMMDRAAVAAEAARYHGAGQPGLVRGEDRPEFVQSFGSRGLTRAEVVADLKRWLDAGFTASGEATPDVYAPDYQIKLARYQDGVGQPVYAATTRRVGS